MQRGEPALKPPGGDFFTEDRQAINDSFVLKPIRMVDV